MRCEDAKLEIQNDFLAKANGSYSMDLQNHLLSCRKCRGHGAKLARIMQAVQLEKMVSPSEKLTHLITSDFKLLASKNQGKQKKRILFALASLLLLLFFGWSYKNWHLFSRTQDQSAKAKETRTEAQSPKPRFPVPENENEQVQSEMPIVAEPLFIALPTPPKGKEKEKAESSFKSKTHVLQKHKAIKPEKIFTPSMQRNMELLAEHQSGKANLNLPEIQNENVAELEHLPAPETHENKLEALLALWSQSQPQPNQASEISVTDDSAPVSITTNSPLQETATDTTNASIPSLEASHCSPVNNFDEFLALFENVNTDVDTKILIELLAQASSDLTTSALDPSTQDQITEALLQALLNPSPDSESTDILYTLDSIYQLLGTGREGVWGSGVLLEGGTDMSGATSLASLPRGLANSGSSASNIGLNSFSLNETPSPSSLGAMDFNPMAPETRLVSASRHRRLAKSTDVFNACAADPLMAQDWLVEENP